MTTPEDLAALWRPTDEAWNKGNLDALDEVYSPNLVYHQPPFPDFVGLAAYKKYIRHYWK
jgi:hypothetical protein